MPKLIPALLAALTLATSVGVAGVAGLATAPPAAAASRVTVANADGAPVVDPTYATTLTVRGNGFQSVRGGHGGVYVFFGAVERGWRPSQGGATGEDYWYVPDSEDRDNQGFQRFVAFPGSDTAGSANGGAMSADGAWSTTLVVPGATFRAYDRASNVRTIDCRKLTCGVITVGAHGVKNGRNETFTPVRVASLQQDQPTTVVPSAAPTAAPAAGAQPEAQPGAQTGAQAGARAGSAAVPPDAAPGPGGSAPRAGSAPAAGALEVDRASAVAGHVLPFTATGLPPGRQVTVVLDDGEAGAGPFLVGQDGGAAGVLTLPEETTAGTHELRVFGVEDAPTVRFAVAEGDGDPDAAGARSGEGRAALVFAGTAALVLLAALVRVALRLRGGRRAA